MRERDYQKSYGNYSGWSPIAGRGQDRKSWDPPQQPPQTPPESKTVSGKLPLIKGPLVDYSYVVDEEGFYDGDEIVQEGNHGDWIWVILEGTAEIRKETKGGPIEILRIGDGAFLGSVAALLSGGRVRNATVKAVGNVQLGMLDSQLLANELANVSAEFKSLLTSIDSRLKQSHRDGRCLQK